MKSWRNSLSVLALSAASALGGVAGYQALQHGNRAWAEEATPALAPTAEGRAAAADTRRPPSPEALAKADDLAHVFRHVGKQVEPTVVNINVRKQVKAPRVNPFDRDMLRRFFPDRNNNGRDNDGRDNDQGNDGRDNDGRNNGGDFELPDEFQFDQNEQPRDQVGTGSGVIMQSDGKTAYILTNNHVAGGAEEMLVTLSDGRELTRAKLVGADPKTDLAVVKVQGDRLPAGAAWGNSDELDKGDWIMAFGSPFGYVGSMTHGIVSAVHRTNVGILGDNGYENFIQVDAPINPGNSGGPLVNLRGEVVGINTAIASRSGGFQGIGFAIPSNQARYIYGQLKDRGKVTRGWLGVSIADVAKNEEVAKTLGYTGTTGVVVEDTLAKTPAYGKLQSRDVITALNGKPVEDVQQLRNTIAATAPDSDVTLTVFREGKTQDVTLKLGEQPEDTMASARGTRPNRAERGNAARPDLSRETLGMRLTDVTPQLARRYDLDDGDGGAMVASVAPRSLAARAGLSVGDVITRVGNTPVKSAREALDVLSKADLSKGVLMDVVGVRGKRLIHLQEKKAQE